MKINNNLKNITIIFISLFSFGTQAELRSKKNSNYSFANQDQPSLVGAMQCFWMNKKTGAVLSEPPKPSPSFVCETGENITVVCVEKVEDLPDLDKRQEFSVQCCAQEFGKCPSPVDCMYSDFPEDGNCLRSRGGELEVPTSAY